MGGQGGQGGRGGGGRETQFGLVVVAECTDHLLIVVYK